jgi:TorA maturation chaperone TorD
MSNEITESDVQDPEALARAGMYGLLARCFARELDPPTLKRLNSEPLRTLLKASGCIPPESTSADTLEELAIDFCQIFLGPSGHCPPYQSVWLQGTFQGELVDSMNGYRELLSPQAFVAVNPDDSDARVESESSDVDHAWPNLAADHAAVQLDLMSRFYSAIAVCQETQSRELVSLPAQYFETHLRWIIDYTAVAYQRSATEFYRTFFKLTAAFLSTEGLPEPG